MKPDKTNHSVALHTVLFGIYPVLALYVINMSEVLPANIYKAVITSCVITFMVVLISLIFRPREKGAVVASLTIFFLFFYGHVFDFINKLSLNSGIVFRHRYFLLLWIVVFAVGVYRILKMKVFTKTTQILNWTAFLLIVLVTMQIVFFIGAKSQLLRPDVDKDDMQLDFDLVNPSDRDVYYILLDAYGRQDLLANDYNVDISNFVSELERLGFYIPNCAQSNYNQTAASMVSTLNMQYLDDIGVEFGRDTSVYEDLIRYNLVRANFERLDYDTVTFKALYPWLNIDDSTYYFDYFAGEKGIANLASLNFQYLFLRTTILRPLVQWLETKPEITIPVSWAAWIPVKNTLQSREYKHYQQSLFALDTLENVPNLPGKKFVYAHLFITHQPFVFYPDGRFHPFLLQGKQAYSDQVVFTNSRMLEIIKKILASSDKEPIIIIQGDHSYSEGKKRVRILNAYYLPDGGNANLYDTITPVNTFRVVFNTYFGGLYEILPDISQYAESDNVLQEVPFTCVQPMD